MNDCEINCLPNFFILGAAKAGTTALHLMLKQHPQIFMSDIKETQFFFNDYIYSRGVQHYVQNYFSKAAGYPARGEASPSYFSAPGRVAPRILANIQDSENIKFVIVLRDPVERAWSHYLHRVRVFAEPYSFEEALRLENQRLLSDPFSWVGYFRDGLYGELIAEWFKYFTNDRFLFIRYESLGDFWLQSLEKIARHLGVNADFDWKKGDRVNEAGAPRSIHLMRLIANVPGPIKLVGRHLISRERISNYRMLIRRLNTKRESKPTLDRNLEQALRLRYLRDIERLEGLLGEGFSEWKPG